MTEPRPAYFDSSVVVKRYVSEQGSRVALRLLREHRPLSSALLTVEILSALRRRRSDLQPRDLSRIRARVRADRDHWLVVEVTAEVLATAEAIVDSEGLRTLDAVHVASAVVLGRELGGALRFVTADQEQADAAAKLGLEVMVVQ